MEYMFQIVALSDTHSNFPSPNLHKYSFHLFKDGQAT